MGNSPRDAVGIALWGGGKFINPDYGLNIRSISAV